MVKVSWVGGLAFEAVAPSGGTFLMDATPDAGGEGKGPTPLEALLASAAACSAMDVIAILHKKRQHVTTYLIEVTWERAQGENWPKPITSMEIKHIVGGTDLDEGAISRAVELSDAKYCSVVATLRLCPKITSTFALA